MTPVLGDPNVTVFLKALSLHQFCSTCTPTICQLHVAENSFMLTTYVSPLKANTSANWNAVSCQIWRGCQSHFCRQWRLKPSASKTISSVFHLHNTSATRELSVYLDGQRLQHESHPTYLGVTLDRTLSYREHCRQAEEPKQLADEASRFHLGCQHQHSVVICSGTLLFSSRVLHPSLVTLCLHKSGRCAGEL